MNRNRRDRTEEDFGSRVDEDTLADQIYDVLGSLLYCAEERLDRILHGLPGMAAIQPLAFGSVVSFSDRRDLSGAGLADLEADFAICMVRAVLVIRLAGEAADEGSPARLVRQRRAVAARAIEDGRPHILLRIGSGGAVTAAPSSADLAPLCNLQWSDLARAVRRLTNSTSVERRLLAQLAALPDTGAKLATVSTLWPLRPMRLGHVRIPSLAATRIVAATRRSDDENTRRPRLQPLVGPDITVTILGRIG
jgi:hypothetical protein